MTQSTREDWLRDAAAHLRAIVEAQGASVPPIRVSVGHDEFDATCNRCGAEFARGEANT